MPISDMAELKQIFLLYVLVPEVKNEVNYIFRTVNLVLGLIKKKFA
jgi:hypothetical protein